MSDDRDFNYNHETDERVFRKDLEEAIKPLRERIVALEILLQQRDMRIRHLQEQLKERQPPRDTKGYPKL